MSQPGPALRRPVGPRDHVAGSSGAPLVLVEYADFECPHCGHAYPVVKQLQAAFGERLCYVFRHFPLTSVHPHAQRAAETAEWVASFGHFWTVHDWMFEHQDRLDDRQLQAVVRDLGLDPLALEKAWHAHTFIARVKEDLLSGIESGLSGTPAFFINGHRHQGPWDVESMTRALETALAD